MAADMLSDLQRHADRENTPTCCTIEVTKHCNFQCRHCYLPRPSPRETIRIPLEVYRRFLHELKQMGGLSVCFTGGEPLLFADDLLDVLGMVRREGMVPTLYTNASLMTREIASSLREGRVLEVAVTLYGSCARTMDDFTGQEGSFDKAIQGIRFLVEENNHVRVRWPVTRDNLEEFTDFYRLVRGLGAQPTHYTCFDPCLDGSREPYKLQMEERDFLRYVDILSTLDIFGTYLAQFQEKRRLAGQRSMGQSYLCSAGRGCIYLGSDGSLYPCTHITRSLGNVLATPLRDIWRDENPVLQEVRSATLDKMKCAPCEYVAECRVCIAESYLENGSFLEPADHACQMARLAQRVREYIRRRYLKAETA